MLHYVPKTYLPYIVLMGKNTSCLIQLGNKSVPLNGISMVYVGGRFIIIIINFSHARSTQKLTNCKAT